MTDLGSETSPLSMTGEQWVLETRTNDPAAPAPDERWIRTDLNEGDRVATLMCGDGTEIPLFPVGLAEETVREARRFNVGGETVFAPLAPLDDASFPERRFQHDGQLHAFHDRVAPGSAIPDSGGTHQWNYDDDSNLTVEDTIGTLNASFTGGTWQSGAGVGDFYLQLDGVDDFGDLGADSQSELSHFVNDGQGTLFAWLNPDSFSTTQFIFGGEISSSARSFSFGFQDGGDFRFWLTDGSNFVSRIDATGVINSNEWAAVAVTLDGSNTRGYVAQPPDYDVIEVDSDTISSTASGDLTTEINLWAREDESETFDGGVDLQFVDEVGWSKSELQNFVDDSKEFYE